MTFMITSSNDHKSDICQFFLSRYIPYCQYKYKISCKMDKNVLRYMFFNRGLNNATPLPPPPPPARSFSGRYFEKIPPKNIATCGWPVRSDLTKAKTSE